MALARLSCPLLLKLSIAGHATHKEQTHVYFHDRWSQFVDDGIVYPSYESFIFDHLR